MGNEILMFVDTEIKENSILPPCKPYFFQMMQVLRKY